MLRSSSINSFALSAGWLEFLKGLHRVDACDPQRCNAKMFVKFSGLSAGTSQLMLRAYSVTY